MRNMPTPPSREFFGSRGSVSVLRIPGSSLQELTGSPHLAQGFASGPSPITGSADMRSRAQPIGTMVTVSIGSSDRIGEG